MSGFNVDTARKKKRDDGQNKTWRAERTKGPNKTAEQKRMYKSSNWTGESQLNQNIINTLMLCTEHRKKKQPTITTINTNSKLQDEVSSIIAFLIPAFAINFNSGYFILFCFCVAFGAFFFSLVLFICAICPYKFYVSFVFRLSPLPCSMQYSDLYTNKRIQRKAFVALVCCCVMHFSLFLCATLWLFFFRFVVFSYFYLFYFSVVFFSFYCVVSLAGCAVQFTIIIQIGWGNVYKTCLMMFLTELHLIFSVLHCLKWTRNCTGRGQDVVMCGNVSQCGKSRSAFEYIDNINQL